MEYQSLFQQRIKNYLDERASEDTQFAEVYHKENKSLEECCDYIQSQVYDMASKGCKGLDDDEVYGIAIHYYDEENISFTSHKANMIVVNEHIELTQDEKDELREKAKIDYQNQEIKRLHDAKEKAKALSAKGGEQQKLFEAKQMNLFD